MKAKNIWIALFAVMVFTSCKDELDGIGSIQPGDAIRFVATTSDSESRTSYGELEGTKWPVYWEAGDVVRVACPQAKDTKWADFTVEAIEANQTEYTLTGTNSLSWGEEDAHHFYTFYPTERVYVTDGNTGTYTVAIPREQNAKVTKAGSDEEGWNYEAVDMSAAVMAGHAEYKRTAVGENTVINLPFKPLTTAFDIVIKAPTTAPSGTTGIESVVITSITIANKADETTNSFPLAGGFTYNAETGYYELYQNTTTNEDAQSYTVNVQLAEPVTLRTGKNDQLTVTAFLLPKGLPKDLRFMVNCRESETSGNMKVQSKTVSINDDQVTANVGKKITLNMGNLPNPIEFSYETWMANLDEDVYVSQISLPGTHDAGAYDDAASSLIENLAITQIYDIPTQFNNGVRVLDFRPECSSDNSEDNFDIAHGLISLDVTFEEVLNNVVTWLANHPTEFIIVQLKNESSSTMPLFSGTKYFTYWQRFMRDKLLKINKNYVIDEFSPAMTLKDARGKILFMSRDDYYSDSNYSAYGGWIGCKVSGWDDNSALWSKTFYTAPHHENSNEGGVGTLWVSDLYKGGTLQNVTENDKKSAIDGCLNAAKNNTDISTWYMTWLNVSDNGTGISNPGRKTPIYNSYVANKINSNDYPNDTYYNTGIIMVDWAGNTEYSGDVVLKAIIDNNFKGKGPAKKQ